MYDAWASRVLPPNEHGCWMWSGAKIPDGYGCMKYDYKTYTTHRLSWMLNVGPITDGMYVLHNCDQFYPLGDKTNRACCAPHHLFLGDREANMADMVAKGRKRGWLFVGEQNHQAKLSDAQMANARMLGALGARCGDVSDWFGIGKSRASMLVRGMR